MDTFQLFEIYYKKAIDELYNSSSRVHQACRYALEAPGKRVRPSLCLLSCASAGGSMQSAIPAAIALEFIHTYSLVHDDLPALDNDDLRRGRETVHKKYGEDVAILVGDALLSDAFYILNSDFLTPLLVNAEVRVKQNRVLAKAIGSQGMVLGQDLDLHFTGNLHQLKPNVADTIHLNKTGQLIAAACALGALSSGANTDAVNAYFNFGLTIGHAFQVIDDILDTKKTTGKSQGKDLEQGKISYLNLMDEKQALHKAKELTASALKTISKQASADSPLVEFALKLLERNK